MEKKLIIDRERSLVATLGRAVYRLLCKLLPTKPYLSQIRIGNQRLLVWLNEDIGRRLFFFRRFEYEETRILETLIREDDCCIDVGGNIGYYAANFCLWCPEGQIHVIEPLTRNYAVLELIKDINKLSNLKIHKLAIGDHCGTVALDVPEEDGAYAHISTNPSSESREFVNIETLDAFLVRNAISKVDILKIDVEGAENLVLDGAKHVLSDSSRQPRIILIELVSDYLSRFQSTIDQVVLTLSKYGYKPYKCNGPNLVPYTNESYDKYFNVFFIKNPV